MSEPVALLSPTELRELLQDAARTAAQKVIAEHRPAGWLSLERAAEYLDTTPGALSKAAQRGHIVGHKSELRRWVFRRDDLDAFAQAGDLT